MMNKKLKLTLGSLGFAAANGAAVPALTYDNSFLNSLNFSNFLGGGISTIYFSKSSERPKPLNLSNFSSISSKSVIFTPLTPISSPKIEFSSEDNKHQLPKTELFHKEKANSALTSLKAIFKEITKTGQLGSLNEQISQSYQQLRTKNQLSDDKTLQNQLKNFQIVKSLVQSQRLKRSVSRSNAKALTREQRISLQNFYSMSIDLKRNSSFFKSILEKIDPSQLISQESSSSNQDSERPNRSIINSLTLIQWSGKSLRVKREGKGFSGAGGWGDWSQNPFKKFYDNQNEYEEAIRVSTTNEKHAIQREHSFRIEAREYGNMIRSSSARNSYMQTNLAAISAMKANSNAHIEHKVAEKLLSLMGQLSKS